MINVELPVLDYVYIFNGLSDYHTLADVNDCLLSSYSEDIRSDVFTNKWKL